MIFPKRTIGVIESDGDTWKHKFTATRKGDRLHWTWVHLEASYDEMVDQGRFVKVKSWVVKSRNPIGLPELIRELTKLCGGDENAVEQLLIDSTTGL